MDLFFRGKIFKLWKVGNFQKNIPARYISYEPQITVKKNINKMYTKCKNYLLHSLHISYLIFKTKFSITLKNRKQSKVW